MLTHRSSIPNILQGEPVLPKYPPWQASRQTTHGAFKTTKVVLGASIPLPVISLL